MTGDWKPVAYNRLSGWYEDDHVAALACFRLWAKSLREKANITRPGKLADRNLNEIANSALEISSGSLTGKTAREFFEAHFTPHELRSGNGFVTAYYEPEVEASRTRNDEFNYPLYSKPGDLVRVNGNRRYPGLHPSLEWARRTSRGYEEFPDRKAIDNGALSGNGLELFWLRSAVEGFYIHVQGSARLLLTDGTSVRVSYAGKSGHPYTSIGKLLVRRGIMSVEEANMVNMRAWLEKDRERGLSLMHENRSFIFFAIAEDQDPDFGPVAAAGVQLTPGRSLAIDKSIHPYGTPVFLSTSKPLPSQDKPFERLMIAQDTGSAIVGPARGDIFIGSGKEAGVLAGSVRHQTDFYVFRPKSRP